jgi:hypothetical protein
MSDMQEHTVLELPKVYLMKMIVFMIIVGIVIAVLFNFLMRAFMANPALNALIVLALLFGILYAFRMVWRLWPEVNWVNHFRISNPGLDVPYVPRLLAPMATMLKDRQGRTVLSPTSMRSLLDSLASRLDESRDMSRYLVGLLIFLGLLGTFWGLLETVTSISDAIKSLDISSTQSSTVFEELKTGLQAPLAGMGLSFSSSLFGLSGSLILGFLDLQATQAQNRFYNDTENWLSSITDIEAGEGGQMSVPAYLRLDMQNIQRGMERITKQLESAPINGGGFNGTPADAESMDKLADAVASLVTQMRDEQKMVRQWAQSQQVQQNEIQRLLIRMTGGTPARGSRMRVEDEE